MGFCSETIGFLYMGPVNWLCLSFLLKAGVGFTKHLVPLPWRAGFTSIRHEPADKEGVLFIR
jgi:hypothetical protein